MSQVYRQSNQENLEQAFSVAEAELGVTRLLDPEGEGAHTGALDIFTITVNTLLREYLSLWACSSFSFKFCV